MGRLRACLAERSAAHACSTDTPALVHSSDARSYERWLHVLSCHAHQEGEMASPDRHSLRQSEAHGSSLKLYAQETSSLKTLLDESVSYDDLAGTLSAANTLSCPES